MFRRYLVVAVAALVASLSPWSVRAAAAQERSLSPVLDFVAAASAVSSDTPPQPSAVDPNTIHMSFAPKPSHLFSTALGSLYATTAIMQALDVRSTLTALHNGAVEANPMLSGITQNRLAFMAVKAGITSSSIFAARQLAKRNKIAAVATLIGINSAYALIVSHNYAVARSLR